MLSEVFNNVLGWNSIQGTTVENHGLILTYTQIIRRCPSKSRFLVMEDTKLVFLKIHALAWECGSAMECFAQHAQGPEMGLQSREGGEAQEVRCTQGWGDSQVREALAP